LECRGWGQKLGGGRGVGWGGGEGGGKWIGERLVTSRRSLVSTGQRKEGEEGTSRRWSVIGRR